ncbi:hypothetical protein DPMN_014992 [Dreissena polymorpha]|uniref:Uncharacterized protein n=1 Tax=Dreissena polymorpha TaxID=45954 RepID=A0A9D4N702_DREPO|nr:hypothetical protein DPMN_014992 [Dreissena polymorpha]
MYMPFFLDVFNHSGIPESFSADYKYHNLVYHSKVIQKQKTMAGWRTLVSSWLFMRLLAAIGTKAQQPNGAVRGVCINGWCPETRNLPEQLVSLQIRQCRVQQLLSPDSRPSSTPPQ